MLNRLNTALLAIAVIFVPAAHAAFLPGSVATTAGGPAVVPGNATGSPAGALLASNVAPYSFATSAGVTSGTLTSAVFQNPTGTLDFYYQFSNAAASATNISRETDTNFSGFLTQTAYRTDGGSLPGGLFQNGSIPPLTADSTGNVVGFSFTPPSSAKVTPGTTSSVLVISTNATSFALGNSSILDGGGQTVSAFQPMASVSTGTVRVCKIAGTGVAVGTGFSFNVAGNAVTVQAGPAPGGACSAAIVTPVGPTGITETIPSGVVLTSVTTLPDPALLVASNLGAGTTTVTVNTGTLTTVYFTDMAPGVPPPPPGPGSLCNAATPVFGPAGDAFQVRYASNLNIGDSFVNITNTGASSTTAFPAQNGNLCVNVYTFSPDEQLISCCSCPVTPNGLVSLSVRNDLISNTLTPGVPTSTVVKLLATSAANNLPAPGLAAWGTTLHAAPVSPGSPAGTFGTTETRFTPSTLSAAELTRITSLCGFIQTNGSGFGICRSCRLGGLGASKF